MRSKIVAIRMPTSQKKYENHLNCQHDSSKDQKVSHVFRRRKKVALYRYPPSGLDPFTLYVRGEHSVA